MFHRSIIRGLLPACLVSMLLMTSGCARKSPKVKTYPVTGYVVSKGGTSLAGGSICFRSLADTSLIATGDIKEDGTFTLHTLIDKNKLAGTAEGKYQVTVLPPLPANHQSTVRPITLAQAYQVEPKENQFQIEVLSARRTR
jgi:hypothetical protein